MVRHVVCGLSSHIDELTTQKVMDTFAAYTVFTLDVIAKRRTEPTDDLFSILVYPTAFVVPHTHRDGHGVVTEGQRVLSGQAWDSRRIIVSWQDIEDGLATGHNVVLHEFAHYLDMEDETMDGAPGLGSLRAYHEWSSVFWAEYERLRAALGAGQPTFLDPYAASEPAEFFAVVTEAFFEKPRELEMQHAGLYEQLRRYYRVDPARWEVPVASA